MSVAVGLSRACGGTKELHYVCAYSTGLSPRLRGNQTGAYFLGRCIGSIPAPAGEPSIPRSTYWRMTVYPRACGGTARCRCPGMVSRGLSPRLRGNRFVFKRWHSGQGSIPAPAGEPRRLRVSVSLPRVYPRACGGTYAGKPAL